MTFTERQEDLIEYLKNDPDPCRWRFAEEVERQGWCTSEQELKLERMFFFSHLTAETRGAPVRPKPIPDSELPMKIVNGFEVPDIALTERPAEGTPILVPYLIRDYPVKEYLAGSHAATVAIQRGMAYPVSRQGNMAVRAHAMAMLGLDPQGEIPEIKPKGITWG